MNKYFLLLLTLLISTIFSFAQKTIDYKDKLIAFNIRNQEVRFNNDKNRVFIISAPLSCSACIKKTAVILDTVYAKLRGKCDYIFVRKGDTKDIMGNRATINHYSKIFLHIHQFLFNFESTPDSHLNISNYSIQDFPILIVLPQNHDKAYLYKYHEISTSSILKKLSGKF